MKAKLLFFLLLSFMLQANMDAYAMMMKTKKRIILHDVKIHGAHRSIQVFPNVFIDGRLLSIELPSIVTSVTATVKDAGIGEIIYSSTDLDVDAITINLAKENAGKYILEIHLGSNVYSGDFII